LGTSPEIALKVDVCNRRALEEGLPALLQVFEHCGVRASFFVTFGPDNSGKAIRRIFRRGFVRKMLRTGGVRTYGLKTALYGTLLPAPSVGEDFPQLLARAEAAGHEVGLHGWDHVGWHDGLGRMPGDAVRASLQRAASLFEEALGHRSAFSGAPGWQANPESLRGLEELQLAYASDCRGGAPFFPRVDGRSLSTLQVPTTLPTSDELLGSPGMGEDDLARYYLDRLEPGALQVLGLHAEVEGLSFTRWLPQFLSQAQERGVEFRLLSTVAERERARAPTRDIIHRSIPGRAGAVACGA